MLKSAKSESHIESGELISVAALSGETKTSHVGTGAHARPAEQGSATDPSRQILDMERPASRPSSPFASSSISIIGGLKTRQKEVGFQVLAGLAQKFHPALDAGAVGGVLAFACPAPTACYEIYAAWKEGDAGLARLKQERISASSIRVASELGIPGVKYALDLNGYYGGPPRLPLLPLTSDLKAEVEKLMADMRN